MIDEYQIDGETKKKNSKKKEPIRPIFSTFQLFGRNIINHWQLDVCVFFFFLSFFFQWDFNWSFVECDIDQCSSCLTRMEYRSDEDFLQEIRKGIAKKRQKRRRKKKNWENFTIVSRLWDEKWDEAINNWIV